MAGIVERRRGKRQRGVPPGARKWSRPRAPSAAAPELPRRGRELPPVAVRMLPCALWQAAVGGPRVEVRC